MSRCLYCYQELGEGETDFHPQCGKKIFGSKTVPLLPYTKADIKQLAEQVIRSQTTLTGVQAKLSLDISSSPNQPQRFTIVGLWGRYILAELAKVNVVPHSLIRFADGELAYITKRIDRTAKGEKLPMEDMCQLSERLTEYKYKGSYEKIAKIIMQYSSVPKLDVINFWEQVVFSWLTGNADMHLKNFSLYSQRKGYYSLTPGYDMISTALLMPEDTEELALTLNGKRRKIKRSDFEVAMNSCSLEKKIIDNLFSKFTKVAEKWLEFIDISFLPKEMKQQYKLIITRRYQSFFDAQI